MDELMLDGNAAAGVLEQLFGRDLTTVEGTCAGCGARDVVAGVRVFRSAGLVLRCPTCDRVLLTIVESGSRTWVSMAGFRALELDS
jgi:ribosomal protein S27E